MNLRQIIEKNLNTLKEDNPRSGNYMFFSNLKQIHRQCEILLNMDHDMIDDTLYTYSANIQYEKKEGKEEKQETIKEGWNKNKMN